MDTKVVIFSVLVSVLAFDVNSCDGCFVCQILANITKQVSSLQRQINLASQLGVSPAHPADSCAAVLQANSSSPSGYYWIVSSKGSPVRVYCDMTRSCGGVTGGWMRVAKLDMTDGTECPSGLKLFTDFNRHTCGIESTGASCSSVTFSTQNGYTKVCGKIRGYQYSSTDAFGNTGRGANPSIDTYYVDGVSLTHGSNPRQHIWTFASALDEDPRTYPAYNCPCTDIDHSNVATPPPAYVGNDYFCDTGSAGAFQFRVLYVEDPLWDGAGCGTDDKCCSFNNPPWFFKKLSQPTSDDIEMRVCRDEAYNNEDIRIEAVDIYVQ